MKLKNGMTEADLRKAIDRAAESASPYLANYIAPEAAELAEAADSQIEMIMGAALMALSQIHGGSMLASSPSFPAKALADSDHPYWLVPQYEIPCESKKYRVDFAVLRTADLAPLLFIECDGHDFHERTKEQAARDKARDRDIAIQCDVPLLRFTGSEVYRAAGFCAAQVFKYLDR